MCPEAYKALCNFLGDEGDSEEEIEENQPIDLNIQSRSRVLLMTVQQDSFFGIKFKQNPNFCKLADVHRNIGDKLNRL